MKLAYYPVNIRDIMGYLCMCALSKVWDKKRTRSVSLDIQAKG